MKKGHGKCIKKVIKEDIKDEKEAKVGYLKLAKHLKQHGNKADARTVKGIAKDEADHKRLLTKLSKKVAKKKTCGKRGKK